ncbi:MAG: tRNA epoxyqueuosine(34) reductase QueG [bacterium]|nr:tRNA epoxyqueuosine(34) reductase QueG [bacterium]
MPPLTEQIKKIAFQLGFDPVGIAPAQRPAHWNFYQDWIQRGFAGKMAYLGRNLDRREDPEAVLPGAKSLLCVGMNYLSKEGPEEASVLPQGQIARYAGGEDYHDVMKARLFELLEAIQGLAPEAEGRVYVDTGPILERDFAAQAGLGWFGKNTCLIHKRKGSWFFLGEILLTLELDFDTPQMDHCGTCTRCLDACPTDAFEAPYVLDSRRCISYLTIELKGAIPRSLRAGLEDWVFGCDICQEVCPWNQKHARATEEEAYQTREGLAKPDLAWLLEMDQATFSRTFKGSPIKRTKRRGLLRNAAVALGNVGGQSDVPVLIRALKDDEPLVRAHAAWALGRIGGKVARSALEQANECEGDPDVREEILLALGDLGSPVTAL